MAFDARFRREVRDVLDEGQEVLVKVIDIDLERRRISLSLKQANEDGAFEEYLLLLFGRSRSN